MQASRLVVLLVALLCAAPSAHAATWKRVTTPDGSNIDQVALVRTADGVLHVAWQHPTSPTTGELMHTTIGPNGAIGATVPIVTGWASLENPALVAVPGGIRVFWGGIRTTNTDETNQELNTALSTDGGATWALQEGSVVPAGAQSYGSPVSAAVLPDGTPLESWAGTLGTWVHAGLTPATPNHDFQAPLGNYGYDTGIATNPAGQTVLAWYSNAAGHLGVITQSVAADGSPVGSPATMPNTNNMTVGQLGRTPIVVRAGGNFYVAFATGSPTLNRIRLWAVGASSAKLIASTHGTSNGTATVAAAPDGRLWVAWKDDVDGKPHLFARRSNEAATVFGETVDGGQPSGAQSLYRVDGSVAGENLDAFGTFSIGTSANVATYVTRLLPGLTLTTKRTSVKRGQETQVTFTVLDAGDPVKGVKVRGGGDTDLTDARGRASLTVSAGSASTLTVLATMRGTVSDSVKLKIRKR